MKPKLRIIHDRKKQATNTVPALVQIEVYYKGKKKYISTGIKITLKEWDNANKKVKETGNDFNSNYYITNLCRKIEDFIIDCERKEEEFSFTALDLLISGMGTNYFRLLNGVIKFDATTDIETDKDSSATDDVQNKCPIMFCFHYGYGTRVGRVFGSAETINFSLGNNTRYPFSLSFDSPDGIYNTFYKDFDEIIQKSFQPVTWKNMNIPSHVLSDFNMCLPVMIDGQLFFPESLKYEISNDGVDVLEFKARTLKT